MNGHGKTAFFGFVGVITRARRFMRYIKDWILLLCFFYFALGHGEDSRQHQSTLTIPPPPSLLYRTANSIYQNAFERSQEWQVRQVWQVPGELQRQLEPKKTAAGADGQKVLVLRKWPVAHVNRTVAVGVLDADYVFSVDVGQGACPTSKTSARTANIVAATIAPVITTD